MVSRAVALVTRNPARFGAPENWQGHVRTRTGWPFFTDDTTFVRQLDQGLEQAGIWSELDTDWILLDGEILPWSLKAGELYASVAAASTAATHAALVVVEQAAASGVDVADLTARTRERADNAT